MDSAPPLGWTGWPGGTHRKVRGPTDEGGPRWALEWLQEAEWGPAWLWAIGKGSLSLVGSRTFLGDGERAPGGPFRIGGTGSRQVRHHYKEALAQGKSLM